MTSYNLEGLKRAGAQAAMLGSILAWALRHHRDLGLRRRDLPRHIKDLLALATGPTDIKYVHFNGRVFFDGWVPPWPSPTFARCMATVPRLVSPRDPAQDRASIYVVVSITNRCVFRCEHCYTAHTLGSKDRIDRSLLLETIDRILTRGVGILSIEGGEPLLRYDDLLSVLELARDRTTPYIATTGWSLTPRRARELADAGLVAAQVSLDGTDAATHNAMRRNPRAFDVAVEAIGNLRQAGVLPITGLVATPRLVEGGGLFEFLEFARQVGALMIQVLDPMPAGANLDTDTGGKLLNRAQRAAVEAFHVEANTNPRWRQHPAVSARLYSESDRFAGCGWGGLTTYYVDALGNVEPCIYTNMAVGNILEEDFDAIYSRMQRLFPYPIGGLCPAYVVGNEEARARAEGRPVPLCPDETARVAARLSRRPLPDLLRKIAR